MKRCCNDISKRTTKRTTRGSIGPQRCHSGYGMVNDMGIHPVKPADKMMWSMDSCVVNGSVGHDAKPQMNYTLSVTLPHEQLAIMIDTVDLRWDPYTKEMIVLVVCRWVDGGYVQGLSHELLYCRASHTGDAGRGRGRERERGMSSELANMTCWGSAAYLGAMLAQLGAMLAHLEAMLAYAYAHKVL